MTPCYDKKAFTIRRVLARRWPLLALVGLSACQGAPVGSNRSRGSTDLATTTPASGTGGTGSGTTDNLGGGQTGGAGLGGSVIVAPTSCKVPNAPRSPLRRLTQFEYNNTVRDLLGDATSPANAFPGDQIGNGFGNDADAQTVSTLLAESYMKGADGIAQRTMSNATIIATLAPCVAAATGATEAACARSFIETLLPLAFRRPLGAGEADAYFGFQQQMRPLAASFTDSLGSVLEATLQMPDFLYRVERGIPDAANPLLSRPTNYEMATRLSYLLWSTQPDPSLRAAAAAGELATPEGIKTHAAKMLADPRSRTTIRFFFDNLLPIGSLSALQRDRVAFPAFSSALGAAMREEAQQLLQYEIFEGSGTWPGVLSAPYTFVNEPLATFYGIPGVAGTAFQKVATNGNQRLGLLTQSGVVAGTIHSNTTNPVVRGAFIVRKLLCLSIPLPTGDLLAKVRPPSPDAAPTARERFTQHRADPVCAGCHQNMDPVGLALENYDPIGQWRDKENGVTIDASGSIPGVAAPVNGPVELARALATSDAVNTCFASHWLDFAYGRKLDASDSCTRASVETAFQSAGFNIQALVLSLTQTDAFLYRSTQ